MTKSALDAMTEADLSRFLAAKRLTSLNAVKAVLNGSKARAFLVEIESLVEAGLPTGSATKSNIEQFPRWFTDVQKGVDAEIAINTALATPPEAPAKTPEAPAAD